MIDEITETELMTKYIHLENRKNYLEKNFLSYYHDHRCTEEFFVLRKRILGNNSIAYVYQCNVCGQQNGSAIKKEKAIILLNGKNPVVYDDDMNKNYMNKKHRVLKLLTTIQKI